MTFKRFPFIHLISILLLWFLFKLLPVFTHPAEAATANFIYAENFNQLKIWCFDSSNSLRFDDSSNYLYSLSIWALIHFFKLSTIAAAMLVNAISLFFTVYLIIRFIDSRFSSVNLLLVGLVFMSTQLWAGILGDPVLFQGMLWLFAVHAFWKHRYWLLMLWSAVNVMARPDNVFFVLPMIIASYADYNNLKERDQRKFIFGRVRRTINFFILPLVVFFTYRYLYFGKILPYNWLHHALDAKNQHKWFHQASYIQLKEYLATYTLPLLIGIVFYFLKEYKKLPVRYYALALSFLIIPMLYQCTHIAEDNFGFKNQYSIYLGLIIFSLLFIRDFRSISQGFTTAIFVIFFGFKFSFLQFQQALQSGFNNEYYIANDLAQINHGKAIVSNDNYISWLTEWQITFANGKHTKEGKRISVSELETSAADIILMDKTKDIAMLKEKYEVYLAPSSTRQYEKQMEPENSVDKFFYKYAHRLPVDKNQYSQYLVWKFGNNYDAIKAILLEHGAKQAL